MNVYGFLLYAHSYLRWFVLIAMILVMVRAFIGMARGASWSENDERLHAISLSLINLQFTLGLLLYIFLSPWVRTFYADIGAAMKDSVLRFYGLEHLIVMVLAVALVHIGRARAKRANTARLRQRRVAVSTLIALLLMLAMIPWPNRPYGRPLFRGVSRLDRSVTMQDAD